MTVNKEGKVVKGLGGLFEVRIEEKSGEVNRVACPAKGILKRDEEKVLIGDSVLVSFDSLNEGATVISQILPRKNALIRPPMANLDYIFIVLAAAKPTPVPETVDKLTAIAVHNGITPVIVVTKSDLDDTKENFAEIYRRSGFDTFVTSSETGEGVRELSLYISENVKDGKTAAFAGASGVGKSTLLNALFPSLSLSVGEISRKIERGKHTTRHVEIFDIEGGGFFADTPGFSLIDFSRFDFFSLDELLPSFPDVSWFSGGCRYADCVHVGEGKDECAVADAVRRGELMPSRLESYRSIYRTLKEKNQYK